MLPGFRFLFTAIVLSMSVLIFGLGAAALLRAAHEEFANLPSRRAAPEPMFARQTDDSLPTLALLRVDPPVADKPTENVPAAVPEATTDAPASVGQTPDDSPAEPEKLAALTTAEPVQAEAVKEAAKPAPSAQETSVETPPAPAPAAEAPVAKTEEKLAAIAETPQPSAVTAPPEPATAAVSPEDSPSAPRIATLGGPAIVVDEKPSAATTEAKPDRSTVKKRTAERARERRQLAARRARLAREAAAQQQQLLANPFAQFQTPRVTR